MREGAICLSSSRTRKNKQGGPLNLGLAQPTTSNLAADPDLNYARVKSRILCVNPLI